MDYIARFGLEFNPFLKNSKDIIVENEEFKEVRFRLNYLAETKGFGVLTGSPGLGKTTALRTFADSLNPSKYKVIYTSLSTLTCYSPHYYNPQFAYICKIKDGMR